MSFRRVSFFIAFVVPLLLLLLLYFCLPHFHFFLCAIHLFILAFIYACMAFVAFTVLSFKDSSLLQAPYTVRAHIESVLSGVCGAKNFALI